MLGDLIIFLSGITPLEALVLLGLGWLVGTAMHEYTVWFVRTMRGWYAGLHD